MITLMFLSLGLWNSALKTRDSGDSERFKIMSLKSLDSEFSENRVDELIGVLGHRAVYYLDWHIRYSGKYSRNVEEDLKEMLLEGRCRPIDLDEDGRGDITREEFISLAGACFGAKEKECREFDINGDGTVDGADSDCFTKKGKSISLTEIEKEFKRIADERGFEFSIEFGEMNVSHVEPWTLEIEMDSELEITSKTGNVGVSRRRTSSANISILGFEDPLLGVESWKEGSFVKPGIKRQIRISEGNEKAREIELEREFLKGKGWAYGELTTPGETDSVDKKHIVVIDDVERSYWALDRYAGVIVETPPEIRAIPKRTVNSTPTCMFVCDYHVYEEISNCLDCMRWTPATCEPSSQIIGTLPCPEVHPPEIFELTGKNNIDVPFLSGVGVGEEKKVLITSQTDDVLGSFDRYRNSTNVSIWNIEDLRELTLCGGYANTTEAPDFIQRLRGEAYSKSENGIESLVYLSSSTPKPLSAVDYLYHSGREGVSVKGMPGCRNADECRAYWGSSFALDEMHWDDYGVSDILCGNSTDPC